MESKTAPIFGGMKFSFRKFPINRLPDELVHCVSLRLGLGIHPHLTIKEALAVV